MSILQEYEQIKKEIGLKEFSFIELFLNQYPDLFLSDVYYNKETWEKYQAWKKTLNA